MDKKSYETEAPVLLCNYTDVYYSDVIAMGMEFMSATASPQQIETFTLRAGDTIITKDSETADDIGISAFVPNDLPGVVCGYHLTMIRPGEGVSGSFVKRLFDAKPTKAHLEVSANGLTRVGLGQYAIDNLTFAWPPREEQTAIATFLDRETAKIDALVAEQQELIALLQEKRQAVISHAVTKGLNPSVPMKDSGVEWLGEVPAHWAISLLKRAFSSVDYGISESLDSDGNIAILRMGNIVDGHLDLSDLKYVNAVDPALLLRAGDLLYNRTNSVDLVGKVGLVTAEVGEATSFASYLVRLRVRSGACAKYFAQLLNHPGFLGLVRSSAFVAIGQCNLNPNRYGEFIVPIPPAAEQDAIANFLESRVYEFDRLVIEAKAAVNLLRERRTALISAAVTGQIDVRGLSA
ncbi:MAG: restriction endonuclease subunit S [Proteobacteria bacterium]|nr:restriction endonuclease subunit S [Pseudomonadota bacterium]